MRWVIGATGVVIGAFGAWFLFSRQDLDQLINAGEWLIAGAILHDAVLAMITIALGALAVRLAPAPARAPLVVAFIVLGSVTLLAVPVLGRFGARADNATLLDRHYTAGWLVLAGITLVAVVVATLVRSRASRGGGHGPSAGRR